MNRDRAVSKRRNAWLWIALLLCATVSLFAEETEPTTREAIKSEEIKQGALVEVDPAKEPIVVLDDGGLIVARPVGLVVAKKSERKLLLDSKIFGRIELPTDAVAGVIFQPCPGTEARDAMIVKLLDDRKNEKRQTDDRVTLVNGDRIEGLLLGIRGRRITVDTAFGKTPIKADRVVSIAFGSKDIKEKDAAAKTMPKYFTGWSDGSRFAVRNFLKTKQKQLQVSVYLKNQAAEVKPWTIEEDQLRFVQPLGDETTVYLSDLTPDEYKHVPFLDRQLKLGVDRNVLGRPLRADGVLYPKGLGVASRSVITYTLAKPYTRFEASLAIDDSTDGRGSGVFRVLLDGKTVYTSPTIRGGQKPVPISVDVTGAKVLELEVDYADRGDQLDRANWLDARLKFEGAAASDKK